MSHPHKCPVCDGSGKVIDERLRDRVLCESCKGSGVVWEPEGQQEATVPLTDPREINGL